MTRIMQAYQYPRRCWWEVSTFTCVEYHVRAPLSRSTCRSDNSVKNHWNGGLSTAYRNRTLRTPYVRRQRTLLPLQGLMDLLQVRSAAIMVMGWAVLLTHQLIQELAFQLLHACREGCMTNRRMGTYLEGRVLS